MERFSSCYTYQNYYDVIFGYGDKVAAEYLDAEDVIIKITYAGYKARIEAAAAALQEVLKERCGSFIGVKMKNSPDWPVVFWAVLMSGNYPLLLDAEGEYASTQNLLSQAGAVAVIGDGNEAYENVLGIPADGILQSQPGKSGVHHPLFGDRIAVCTSGTTGSIRVFVYDGEAMGHQINNAKSFFDQSKDLIYEKGELKNLAFLPLHHIFGFIAVYLWYSCGGKTIVYPRDRSPATILKACRRHKVTHIFCVPLFWNNITAGILRKVQLEGGKLEKKFDSLLKLSTRIQTMMPRMGWKVVSRFLFAKVQKNLFGTSIRFLINGGGRILPESLRIINILGYPLYNGFGMTETGITSVELSVHFKDRLLGTVGSSFDSVSYRIDSEDGHTGELLISGSSLYSGKLIDGRYIPRDDQWFRTGDIGRMESGRLYIEGRLKEVIIGESGENVYPDEVEGYFQGLLHIASCCVIGLDGGNPYEDIVLVLELEKEAGSREIENLANQINTVNKALPFVKKVRMVLVSEDPLPLVNGIKVQRQRLKYLIENGRFTYHVLDLSKKYLANRAYQEESGLIENDPRYSMLREDVRLIFSNVLGLPLDKIGDFDHFFNDLGGDSLTVISLMTQMEEAYNISMPFSELSTLPVVNVKEIAELTYFKLYGANLSNMKTRQEIVEMI